MPELTEDLDSITPPMSEAMEYVARLSRDGEPANLSINGKVCVVVRGARLLEDLLALIERAEDAEAIRQGLEDVEQGRTISLEEFDEQMRRRFNLPRRT